jgi:hypothetical protein
MYVTKSAERNLLMSVSTVMLHTSKGYWCLIDIRMSSVWPATIPLKKDERLRDKENLEADYIKYNTGKMLSIRTAELNTSANALLAKFHP